MKLSTLFINLLQKGRKTSRQTLDQYKREILISQGKIQFEALLKRGLSISGIVAL